MNNRSNSNEDAEVQYPENKKQRNRVSVVKVAGLTALILMLIFAAAFVISDSSGFNTEKKSDNQREDIFYSVVPESVADMSAYSDGLVTLTDTAVVYADSGGNEIAVNSHTYSNPAMCTNKKNVLVYDRGGYSFRIEKNGALYNEFTLGSVITSAAIGSNGNYAYALNSDSGFQSHLFVYSYNGKLKYEWGSALDYCIGIALSDNGKYCAVALAGVENAELYTVINLFDFSKTQPLYSVKLPGVTAYELSFISGKKLAAFTDSGIYSFSPEGEYTVIYSYTSAQMCHSYKCPSGLSGVAVLKYSNNKLPVVTVFDKRFNQLFENSYTNEITSVVTSESYIAVVFESYIEVLNSRNTTVGKIDLNEACLDVCIAGKRLYVLTAGGLYSYYVNSLVENESKSIESTSALQE